MTHNQNRPVCDYEGSAYRTEFWGQERQYEDAVERVALQHMLPSAGQRLIDIGGGYGRLFPLYDGYDEVILFDYALSQLRQAQDLWGTGRFEERPRYIYVAGDFYNLPFAPAVFNTIVMVRTIHHAADVPSVLQGVAKILAPGGSLVLEFANKRNVKAILRYLTGGQDWSPFDRQPVEFVPLNFDFHPAWIERQLSRVGLHVHDRRAVSTFRLNLLKRWVPTTLLVTLDRVCQPAGGFLPLSPSVFVRCEALADKSLHQPTSLFRCTACHATSLEEQPGGLSCTACGSTFPVQDGIYNFKTPCTESPEPSGARSLGTEARGPETGR